MWLDDHVPDVPDNLIHEHEVGRVVFFCGAGISVPKPAHLPNFRKLAKRIFKNSNLSLPSNLKSQELDVVFSSLQERFPGNRQGLLEKIFDELSITGKCKPQDYYHSSLLSLATNRTDGSIRLVTTNYDLIFDRAKKSGQNHHAFIAPALPVPKPNRWDGLVYLHGKLPERKEQFQKGDNIVVTSGDLGQAYLSEGWAARFIVELFRNFCVCFVGYSMDDPVMRYLADAMAKDENSGLRFPETYIFLSEDDEQITNRQPKILRGFLDKNEDRFKAINLPDFTKLSRLASP